METTESTSPQDIELNDDFVKALRAMEKSNKPLFITGRAGTGKSTLLTYFRSTTKKNIVVLAPTGVAALNVRGHTIHSFFHFGPDITPEGAKNVHYTNTEIFHALETIVIDEISMVRADLLDCIDIVLRKNGQSRKKPFGGIQVIFIGDLYQLPPVVTGSEKTIFKDHYPSPYFFDAHVFKDLDLEFIELQKIYRQKDDAFILLLNAVRNNSITLQDIEKLNDRLDRSFEPPPDKLYINLTTTNAGATAINERELAKLKTPLSVFTGKIQGSFKHEDLPTALNLHLKDGAQVMMVNNDVRKRWVNGTVGKISSLTKRGKEKAQIRIELANGREVEVAPNTWDVFRVFYNKGTSRIDSESIGSFTQYPLRLAWAVTIHKGQGKTFERVILDIERGTFCHGQLYVALSRCTSLGGLVLKKPIQKKHIWMDWRIVRFLTNYQYGLAARKTSVEERTQILKRALARKQDVEITYLKSNDEKSKRIIRPIRLGNMEYMGKSYLGVEAYCRLRKDTRVFRIDRILDIREPSMQKEYKCEHDE